MSMPFPCAEDVPASSLTLLALSSFWAKIHKRS